METRYYKANPWMVKHSTKSIQELAALVHGDFTGSLYGYYLLRCTWGK